MSNFNRLPPSGFNLPPGVSNKDIEPKPFVCYGCGEEITDEDDVIEINNEVYHEVCAPEEED